jgi:hypothetical protein
MWHTLITTVDAVHSEQKVGEAKKCSLKTCIDYKRI